MCSSPVPAAHPALDLHRDRRRPDLDDLGIAGHLVTDEHRAMEGHCGDRHGRGATSCTPRCRRAAREVHLRQQPAAENVPVRIGIGRHGDGAKRRLRLGRMFGGRSGVHGSAFCHSCHLRRNHGYRSSGETMTKSTPEDGIGQPVIRKEDAALLIGQGRFSDDLNLAGQAYAVMVRSPHAHARIRAIDAAAAMALPGVIAVLTGAEAHRRRPQADPAPAAHRTPRYRARQARHVGQVPLTPPRASPRQGPLCRRGRRHGDRGKRQRREETPPSACASTSSRCPR